jgi:TrkA domain protein
MATRETELPGVGTKYSIDLATGEQLVLVEHRLGHWEVARVEPSGDTVPIATLQEREAAELGRILSRGTVPLEEKRKEMLFHELSIEWVKLERGCLLVGETLQGTGIRARTGVSVIAVLRPEGSLPNPPPETELRVGDTLVVIGQREQVEAFLTAYSLLPPSA